MWTDRGVAMIIQREDHTVLNRGYSIIAGCMLKKAYKRERWGLRAPQTPIATTLSLV